MSDQEFNPDKSREEIIQDAAQTKAELEAKQSEMLEAVASGENAISVQEHEVVEVGEVDVTVKAYMPGESLNSIKQAQRLAKRENLESALDSIYTMVEGMTAVTVKITHPESGTTFKNAEQIRQFWKGMFEEWGIEGFQEAAGRVLEPASDDLEEKSEAVDGFRPNKQGKSPRARDGTKRSDSG